MTSPTHSLVIEDDTLVFGSYPEFYHPEKSNTKCNTLRAVDKAGIEYLKENPIWKIRIFNRAYPDDEFTREITNVCTADMYQLEDGRVLTLFSWKPCYPVDDSDDILSRAISHYGEPAQVLKCIEELAELQVALCCHLKTTNRASRNLTVESLADRLETYTSAALTTVRVLGTFDDIELDNTKNYKNVASELADVSLTTSQMLKIFNCSDEVERIKQEKLCRLEARMRGDSQ